VVQLDQNGSGTNALITKGARIARSPPCNASNWGPVDCRPAHRLGCVSQLERAPAATAALVFGLAPLLVVKGAAATVEVRRLLPPCCLAHCG